MASDLEQPVDGVQCSQCEAPGKRGDNWCEACGAPLGPSNNPASTQSAAFSAGFGADDDAGVVAVAVDRGRQRAENQDAAAVSQTPPATDPIRSAVVLCDGVASTEGAGSAATVAVERGIPVALDGGLSPEHAVSAAVADAQQAVGALGAETASGIEPPSSTVVVAVVQRDGEVFRLDGGWLGDSRAYWLGSGDAELLTTDHEIGGALSRWLGADSIDPEPDHFSRTIDTPGLLLVCSDGLWRYAPAPHELYSVVTGLAREATSLADLAHRLVEWANTAGGHDNISVALWASPGWAGSLGTSGEETQ